MVKSPSEEQKAHLGSFAGTGFLRTALAAFVLRPQAEVQIGAAHQGWGLEGP